MRARWELDFIEEVTNLYNLKLVGEIKNYPKPIRPHNYYWWWEK